METQFDINKVAGDFIQHNFERLTTSLGVGAKGVKDQVLARFKRTFSPYITKLLERHARGKSFFVRTEAIPLYDFFVPLDLATQLRTLTAPDAEALAEVSRFSIITGSGGSGKSMMMRHLLVSAIKANAKIPVFLELRLVNASEVSIRVALLKAMQDAGFDIDEAFFEIALKAGEFFFLLDGFDELERSVRKKVASEVRALAQRFSRNWIAMSSRPDAALDGWDEFTQFKVCPLSLEAAVTLVEKIPFDPPVKLRFVADMRDQLFKRHESFLSNPLLLSIMLLTYRDVAHIPLKLSAFYAQAYESLFQRHDALKAGFKRERQSGLDLQDFARAFAAFSLLSYDKREFSFTRGRALALIDEARGLVMFEFESGALLDDSIQAACMLIEDGMDIAFSHRSFQEYFVARFIQESAPEVKERLVKRFIPSVGTDTVMALLFELDPYTVEKVYLLPALAAIGKKVGVKRAFGTTHYVRYVQLLFESMHRSSGSTHLGWAVKDMQLFEAIRFTMDRFREPQKFLLRPADDASLISLSDAFVAEFGGRDGVPTSELKPRGQFVARLAQSGGVFLRTDYIQAVLEIETEIRLRHEQTRESLEQVLARPSGRTTR